MKNKAFTLVELLAVIVILGVLLSISTVAVVKIKKQQDVKNTENTISSILTGAKRYASDHPSILSSDNKTILVSDLLNEDYVDFDNTKISLDSVIITTCSNSLKLQYSLEYEGTNYNDCGCVEQSTLDSSNICKE